MSDHRHRPPLSIRPARSARLLIYVCIVHASALVVLLPLPPHAAIKSALAVLTLSSLGYVVWARILNRAPWSIIDATWAETGWRLTTAAGRTHDARLCASTYVGVGLVILNLRSSWFRRHSLVLTPDSIDADQLRRLRARLRLVGAADTGGGARSSGGGL